MNHAIKDMETNPWGAGLGGAEAQIGFWRSHFREDPDDREGRDEFEAWVAENRPESNVRAGDTVTLNIDDGIHAKGFTVSGEVVHTEGGLRVGPFIVSRYEVLEHKKGLPTETGLYVSAAFRSQPHNARVFRLDGGTQKWTDAGNGVDMNETVHRIHEGYGLTRLVPEK